MAISLDTVRKRIAKLRNRCEDSEAENGISLAHFTSAFDVPALHWNKLFHESNNFLLSAPYLAALEQHPYGNMCFHYVVAYEKNNPIAILYYQETDVHITNIDKNVDTEKVGDTRSIFDKVKGVVSASLESVKIRLLINGNLLQSGRHGSFFSASVPLAQQAQIVDAAWNKVVESNRSGKKIRAILVKDISPELETELVKVDAELIRFAVQPNMISTIRPEWKAFDDVLNDFSSKYRVRAKAACKKSEHLKVKELDDAEIKLHNDTIIQLFKNVERGADFHMVSINPRYFMDLKAALEDRFIVVGYFDDDNLVGFYSYIKGVNENYASFVGINYDYNADCALYQNMLYHLLDNAIKDGAVRIDLARTAMEIKSTLGAEPETHMLLTKHLNGFTNSILRRFIENLRPKEWVQRKPFK
ncbi:hypothetical protein ACFLR1_04870 [Bacteroidota bacterium]